MIAELATAAPNGYNCAPILALPYKGAEILVIASIFLALLVCFAVTFLDVAAKQMWPSFMDPAVAARLAEIQRMFPNLGAAKAPTSGTSAADGGVPVKKHTIPHPVTGAPIEYDAVVSAEPYVSSKTVDEDLIVILANNEAFSTVSSYCACSVRGYAMLSVMLTGAALCLALLWCHNAMVDQRFAGTTSWVNQVGLLGYCLAVLTAVVMTGPSGNCVGRNANQLLWFNIPLPSPYLKLHDVGIVGFVLLPFLAHLLNALTYKDMPNRDSIFHMSIIILIGAVWFGTAGSLHKCLPMTELMGKKIGIIGEVFAVFSAMVSFAHYEVYAPATCAGMLAEFEKMLLVAFFAPFGLMAVKQYNRIDRFVAKPSLLLTFNGNHNPVATVGPCPVQRYNNVDSAELPHLSEDHLQAVSAKQ